MLLAMTSHHVLCPNAQSCCWGNQFAATNPCMAGKAETCLSVKWMVLKDDPHNSAVQTMSPDAATVTAASYAEQKHCLLGVGLELGAHLALLELLGETLVVAPKQANIWNVKQDHGQTLQAQPGGSHKNCLESVSLSLYSL